MTHKQFTPVVTIIVCSLCVFLYYAVPNPFPLLVSPYELINNFSLTALGKATLSGFLHANFKHLFTNLFIITFLGYALEKTIGSKRMLGVIICSLLGAGLVHIFSDIGSTVGFLGASGMAFGVILGCALRL